MTCLRYFQNFPRFFLRVKNKMMLERDLLLNRKDFPRLCNNMSIDGKMLFFSRKNFQHFSIVETMVSVNLDLDSEYQGLVPLLFSDSRISLSKYFKKLF